MMERLTEHHVDGKGAYMKCSEHCEEDRCGDCGNINHIIDRLAAYEDTGFTPEEISQQRFFIAALKDPEKLARLRDIVLADEAGRLVVLPCKAGDIIYQMRKPGHARGPGISPRIVSCVEVRGQDYAVRHQGMEACLKRNLGKTWFLTEEAARVAMKKEAEHGAAQA